MSGTLRRWARQLKSDLVALWFTSRHPSTPFFAKVLAVVLVAYAFSPIDLISDFVPVLGYLDDLILLPLGLWVVIRMLPDTIIAECRAEATAWLAKHHAKPRSYFGMTIVIGAWIALGWLAWRWLAPMVTLTTHGG
jgi:uncharacterized membrane protein YkvA (DUF1232 family)